MRLIASIFALALMLGLGQPAAAAEMLIVTDIHFNPMADKALVDRLEEAEPAQWAAILDSSPLRMSAYGEDTNWPLLRSALAAMTAGPKPDFALAPGDFLAHRFRALFDAASTDRSDAAFRRFTAKTMRFLGLQLEAAWPHTPIFPALGNNDELCGDFELRPGDAFLADTEDIAAAMIGTAADAAVRRSWRALGNYVVPNPAAKDQLIAIVNTNFLSPRYKNACGTPADGNPAAATLAWLGGVLGDAAAAGRKVWLVYHVPPGIDAFASAEHDVCPIEPVPMFAEPYAGQFHALMRRYRGTVTASFAGHTHMDGFRLEGENGHAFGFVMGTPAVSPIFGQNPAFRRVTLGADGTLADETVSYLANLGEAQRGGAAQWRDEASFDSAWGLPRFDRASLTELSRRMAASTTLRDRWLDRYAVQGPARSEVDAANFAVYRCAAGNDRSQDFARCTCAGAAR